mmetsp:Transcript_63538/g.160313  ORF Transcript_63538/g.160313 Transcript_63538/m.160313 type:complete len:457 (+) Transcript_63538:102-1472(+)
MQSLVASQSEAQDFDRGEFRSRAPWLPSTHRLAATQEGGHHRLHREASPCSVLSPSGWPRPPSIEGLFDPLPDDAKRFVWENDDGTWVNGTLADRYLRNLMLHGEPETTAMRVARPMSPTDIARSSARRGRCQVGHGSESACGCLCPGYDPVIAVPLSLVDKIELNNDVRPIANQIVSEANIGASLRRAGLERDDIVLEAFEKQYPRLPLCHRVRFRAREEKRLWLRESAGLYLADSVEEQVEKSEFELNVKMLPDLRKWLERYRSVKLTRLGDAARQFAKDCNLDAERLQDSMQDSPGRQDSSSGPKFIDPDVAVAKAYIAGPARPVMLCRCGHAEVFHEKPQDRLGSPQGIVGQAKVSGTAGSLTMPAVLPPGPDSLMKTLPAQGPAVFSMIADKGKPQPPPRSRSEPSISGGRLLLRAAGQRAVDSDASSTALLASAALGEQPQQRRKKKKGR